MSAYSTPTIRNQGNAATVGMGELVVVVVENWLQVNGADATPALEQDMLENITHARAQASRSEQVHVCY